MKKLLIILLVLLPLTITAKVEIKNLRVENLSEPLGIDTSEPRFSWRIVSDKKDVRQTAYQIIVSDDKGEVWNTGKVMSDEQLWISYKGQALKSGTFCTWKVKVFTNKGETPWTNGGRFSIGLLNESKWSGYWIGLESLQEGEERGFHTRLAARYLRKEFKLKGKSIKRATAYVAGIGLHEFYVNGKKQGDRVLSPVPSDYRKTIYYNTYDITSSLKSQQVCLGIALGNGRLFPMQQHKSYKIPVFGLPKCRINVIVEYQDGTKEKLQSDDKGWKVSANGPIRSNNEYDGELYDACQELEGWASCGFDDSKWLKAQRTDIPQAYLRGQMTEGMKVLKTINPVSVTPSKGNGVIIDLGQNMTGWLKAKIRGQKGDTIRLVYAEKLNADGTLYRDNFRNAQSTDTYICNGKEGAGRWWAPTFVYHGFKYVEVIGLKDATKADFIGEQVSDEMESIGQFECSDTIINKVMRNAWWGILDNYKGMPVDCPQRDERQPWLGDRTVGSLGESFLFNNERLYTKWMRDICEAQRTDGCIPDVAPTFWNYFSDNITWPSALPFSCDMLHRQFGNKKPIIDSYPYIRKWINHIIEEYEQDGIINQDKYGDWCPPPEKLELIHSQDPNRKTDGSLMSTAYIIRCLQLMNEWAQMQGFEAEADYFAKKRESMIKDFNRHFLTIKRGTSPRPGHVLFPDSVYYGNNTATANLLPLAFGIVPDDCREDIVKQVVENICIKNKGHVSCGVIGISWLLRGLSDNGFADVAYLIAKQKKYPSWGYMAEQGATTIWELWNGDKASPRMNSGNHVMLLGDLITWCYQYLGGIRSNCQSEFSAYKRFSLQPAFDIQDCEWTNVSYNTPYGKIVSNWKKTLQHMEWHIEVPCNTTADINMPDGSIKTVGSGTYDFSVDIPTSSPAIVKDEFLYEHTFFPEAHASTIAETKKGDLVSAYFGGTHERDPDVCIYVNIKKKGKKEWSTPILAADGVFELGTPHANIAGIKDDTTPATAGPVKSFYDKDGSISYDYNTKKSKVELPKTMKRKSCWNPILFEMPDGELWLFFKIGSSVGDWTGWLTKSKDGGLTWSDKEPLPEKFLGPIKNKPELIDGRLLCGSSTEGDGWRFHMEILDLKTGQWKYVPVESTDALKTDDNKVHPIDCIQPSILKLKDGRLQVLMRTHNARLATSYSSDNGDTWTPVTLSEVENNQSGTDAVTLKDGRHALIYNNFATLPMTKKGPRTPLSIAISEDGERWQHALTLEDSPIDQYSYPAIIQGKNGHLYCVYTWRRQRIVFKEIDLKKLR